MRFSAVRRVASTGSTNDDMLRVLGDDDARGLTIVADYQSQGSGRKGRAWIAPPGSALLFTTALPNPIPARDLWAVPFWIGVAVHEALSGFGVAAQLQWPNDVLLNGAKLAGILCISRVSGDAAWAACGVGINVRRPQLSSDVGAIIPPPAFLSDVRSMDRDELLAAILRRADDTYDTLRAPDTVARAWEGAAGLPGARYRLVLDAGGEAIEGSAVELGEAGELIVEGAQGRRAIAQADARVVR